MTRHGRLGLPEKDWSDDVTKGPLGGVPRLRSLLYTPADRGDRIKAALVEGKADVVVADLEDAVAPGRKAEARKQLVAAWAAVPRGRTLRAVRINRWPSPEAEADLDAVLPGRPDLIAVPKCEVPAALHTLDSRLKAFEASSGLLLGSLKVMIILETAAGVLAARELAGAAKRIAAVAFGAEDLAADAGLRRSPGNAEVAVPRALVALAAAAAGVAAIDMITADARDLERTARETAEARALGYSGKMCIHPLQVVAVHEALRPTASEIEWARKVVAAVGAAGVTEGGVVVVDGKMVDVPFIRQARRILADAA
ncbi:MAG: CoA ester lyase [bacterium]